MITRDHLIEEPRPSEHHPMAICSGLPGNYDPGSEVVVRRVALHDVVICSLEDSLWKHAVIVSRGYKSGERAACPRRARAENGSVDHAAGTRVGYSLDQARPDVRKVTILLAGPPVIFPAQPKVYCQAGIELEIVLNKKVA